MALTEKQLQAMWDKQAISEVLARYCHGVDRLDRKILESVYWPDGLDNHLSYNGTASGFIDWVLSTLATMNKTRHFIGNIMIDLDSETRAHTETYIQAYHQLKTTFGLEEFTVGARFLDIFEKRGEEWRIYSRTLCIDHSTHATGHENPRYADAENTGKRFPDDPYYRLFA